VLTLMKQIKWWWSRGYSYITKIQQKNQKNECGWSSQENV